MAEGSFQNRKGHCTCRIGQKNTVYSVKLITKNSVEEKVLAMQPRKKSAISATLEKDGSFTQSRS